MEYSDFAKYTIQLAEEIANDINMIQFSLELKVDKESLGDIDGNIPNWSGELDSAINF